MTSLYGRPLSLLFLGALVAGGPLQGASLPDHPWCGTTRSTTAAQLAIHRDHQQRLEREDGKSVRDFPEASRSGDVALLADDGSLIVQPNPFDLPDAGVQFVPQKKGGAVASPADALLDEEIGGRIDLSDDDSHEVALPKNFRFRYFGRAYTRMFVHSDGNLTFGAPDAASTDRDLDRLISGPPRIAPFFADLDPTAATGDGGVYVSTSATKVVVTWLNVPEFGKTTRNTFQAVLTGDGRIRFAFGAIAARAAVVGVAPGGNGQVQLLDYSANLPSGIIKTGIAERFVTSRFLDNVAIARAFFREFADTYDHLIVFLDFQQSLGGGTFAFESGVKNDVRGIGLPIFDASAQFGSRGRLRAFVQMGTLSRYPDDPETTFLGTNSTLDVLGQEAGHRWLSFFNFTDGNGEASNALLGRDLAHWSFCHNSLASDMEGNLIREDGGDRFTTTAATERYSPLDQYAMGLISAAQVPSFFYVDGCPTASSRSASPEIGVGIQGPRVDVTIDQIVAANGPRVPAAAKAPHQFTMAFIVVGEAGQLPSDDAIAKVDRLRAAWEPYFAEATEGHGSVSTALVPKPRR